MEFSTNAEHLTVIPVISTDIKAWLPLIIFFGMIYKFRKRMDGKMAVLHDLRPCDSMIAHRTPPGMDTDQFLQ